MLTTVPAINFSGGNTRQWWGTANVKRNVSCTLCERNDISNSSVLQNFTPVGMPYSAGYACGYYLVQSYLKQTGKSIVEATVTHEAVMYYVQGLGESKREN